MQHAGGGRHHVSHGALDVNAAFHIVGAQFANAATHQVRQGSQGLGGEADFGVVGAKAAPIGKGDLNRNRQCGELALGMGKKRVHSMIPSSFGRRVPASRGGKALDLIKSGPEVLVPRR